MSLSSNEYKSIDNTKMIFDLETTGIFDRTGIRFNQYPDPTNLTKYKNARIVSIGYIIINNTNTILEKKEFIIKPFDFIINNENIHGISMEYASKNGINIDIVFSHLDLAISKYSCNTLIGHNIISFDIPIILSELYRINNTKLYNLIKSFNKIDTMVIGKLHFHKSPKLTELYEKLFNQKMEIKHNALYDAEKCLECYLSLLSNSNNLGDKIMSIGKYKGYSFEKISQNYKRYANFIMNETDNTTTNDFKLFKKYINQNNINLVNDISDTIINCSRLADYYKNDKNINDFINIIDIQEIHYDKLTIFSNDIPPNILGIFIDYLFRYEIHKYMNKYFEDNRTKTIISNQVFDTNDIELFNLNDNNKELAKSIDIIKISYTRAKKLSATLTDILNISISHSLCFCEYKAMKYINMDISKLVDNTDYDKIKSYIQSKLLNKKTILCNPILSDKDLKISGDADLIIDNEIIDFKYSKYIDGKITDFIQLLIYSCLYYKKYNIICNKLTIYNPYLGLEKYIIIDENILNQFLNILIQRVNSSNNSSNSSSNSSNNNSSNSNNNNSSSNNNNSSSNNNNSSSNNSSSNNISSSNSSNSNGTGQGKNKFYKQDLLDLCFNNSITIRNKRNITIYDLIKLLDDFETTNRFTVGEKEIINYFKNK